ncbi:hypothetical protein FRC10_008800 [Ceratobasidium sp. 414]|nr:hypothetical protein FRC10_008800 [Ceratobasidium sp. 414]
MLVVTPTQFEANTDPICQQLLAARRITVLCGAGVSTAAGIPVSIDGVAANIALSNSLLKLIFYAQDFRSPEGLYSRRFMRDNVTLNGRDLFSVSTVTKAAELAIFSLVLTEMRIQARTAAPTSFHKLIRVLNEKGCLQRCYTQNFDGLQTRDFPHLAERVFELHGNNNTLICRACKREAPGPIETYDEDLKQTGVVECPYCRASGPLNLLKSMARTVRERRGAVVYVDRTTASQQLSPLFDMQLQVDVQQWALTMLAATRKVRCS